LKENNEKLVPFEVFWVESNTPVKAVLAILSKRGLRRPTYEEARHCGIISDAQKKSATAFPHEPIPGKDGRPSILVMYDDLTDALMPVDFFRNTKGLRYLFAGVRI